MLERNKIKNNEQFEDKPLAKWVKQGDFSKTINSGSDLNNYVEYHNVKVELGWENKEEIFIGGYYHTDELQIAFSSKRLSKILLAKCKELEIFVKDDLIGGVRLHTNDKKIIATFINAIDDVIPLGKEIKKEIFDTLHLKQIADEENFYQQLKSLIDSNKFEEALELTKSVEDDHALWNLGKYCENVKKFEEAINSYQEITEDNPHYQEANFLSAHLIMQYLNDADREKQNITSIDKQKYLELEFKFLLRANKDMSNQRLVDQIYHQLCGSTDLHPSITVVKTDEDTLIALAQQMTSLHQKNKLLTDKIADLEQQILKKTNTGSACKQKLFNSTNTLKEEQKDDTYCGFKPGFLK